MHSIKSFESITKILTTFLFVTRDFFFCWSQVTAVLSTVRWRGIGAGSYKFLCSSSTRHTALRNRPISVATINSWERKRTKKKKGFCRGILITHIFLRVVLFIVIPSSCYLFFLQRFLRINYFFTFLRNGCFMMDEAGVNSCPPGLGF